MVDEIRAGLAAEGIPIIPAEQVAATVLHLLGSERSGECWFVQAGRDPGPFEFRGLPGPR